MMIETNNNITTTANSTTEQWFKSHWRPMMAYVYMVICIMDFVGFPLLTMFLPKLTGIGTYIPWKTLTLEGGGLIHMAFGAILGISAWTRGTEKVTEMQLNRASINYGNQQYPSQYPVQYPTQNNPTVYERSEQTIRPVYTSKGAPPKGRPETNGLSDAEYEQMRRSLENPNDQQN
jgi:Holin of 3TMs, for gene-transfer release